MSAPLIALITGANQGLGLEASIQLAQTGEWHVLMGCRDVSKGEKARSNIASSDPSTASRISVVEIDILSDDSIAAAAEKVRAECEHLDVLINNAGANDAGAPSDSRRQHFVKTFDLNVASHAIVTDAFLPLLKESTYAKKRVVMVSSSLGSLTYGSNPKHMYYATFSLFYRPTKSATNMLATYLANTLKEDGIAVTIVCPGFCKTDFNNHSGVRPASDGGRNLVVAATEKDNEEVTGKWFDHDGPVPW